MNGFWIYGWIYLTLLQLITTLYHTQTGVLSHVAWLRLPCTLLGFRVQTHLFSLADTFQLQLPSRTKRKINQVSSAWTACNTQNHMLLPCCFLSVIVSYDSIIHALNKYPTLLPPQGCSCLVAYSRIAVPSFPRGQV